MPRDFTSRVNHVQSGSAVSAGNTGRATRELEARTNYIRERLDAAEAGRALVFDGLTLDASVVPGKAVYWDAEGQKYALALAGVVNDETLSSLVPTAASEVLGVCIAKETSTQGTIAFFGAVEVTPTMLEAMTGDSSPEPGRYYLSATTEGLLVKQRPPVTVAVLHLLGPSSDCETNSWIVVNPQMRDFLEDHVHYQIDLFCQPSGDHAEPAPGDVHVIENADVDIPGWLPADHASFDGQAPSGAKFGYNLAAHPELNGLWPPIPPSAAVMEMLIPDELALLERAGRVTREYVRFDQYGIWWMTACRGEVPWPQDYEYVAASSSSIAATSSSSLAEEVCERPTTMRAILSFVKMTFATDKTVVTSLAGDEGQPIVFVNCDGETASTGDLKARLDVDAMIDATEVYGGQAIKTIPGPGLKFGRGYLVEGLIAGSENVLITSTRSRGLDPTLPVSASNPRVHQTIATIDVLLNPTERELSPQISRLQDAKEGDYLGHDFLRMPALRNSGLRMRFEVPPAGVPLVNPRMKMRLLLFGTTVGPFCAMTMVYRRVVRPTANTPTTLANSDTSLTFDVVTPSDNYDGLGGNLPAGRVIEVESSEFTIAAGDTVIVTLARASNASPSYAGDIGVLRVGGVIFQGE